MKQEQNHLDLIGIRTKEVVWSPHGKEKPVLNRISIAFEPGNVYGIIGPNGSGKTSFLRHILRFLNLQQGEIWMGDRVIGEWRRRQMAKRVAFVPQDTRLDTDFSAYDVVMMGRNPYQRRFGGITKEDKICVEGAMKSTNSWELRDACFRNLSGGEAQRVVIARAIAQNTDWILLDEPASSLDIRHQVDLMAVLRRLNEEKGISVILVLHDMNLAAWYCDRIVMMKGGTICYEGETKEVMTEEHLGDLYDIPFVKVIHPMNGKICFFPA